MAMVSGVTFASTEAVNLSSKRKLSKTARFSSTRPRISVNVTVQYKDNIGRERNARPARLIHHLPGLLGRGWQYDSKIRSFFRKSLKFGVFSRKVRIRSKASEYLEDVLVIGMIYSKHQKSTEDHYVIFSKLTTQN